MDCADPSFTGLVANSGAGRTVGENSCLFRLTSPARDRSRPTAASSARTPSRPPRNQSPCSATAWPRTWDRPPRRVEGLKAADPRHRPLDPEMVALDPLLQVLAD